MKKRVLKFRNKYLILPALPFLHLYRRMNQQDINHSVWIRRCFDLAARGIGYVSPNPPVGAVLVYKDRIIGEGFHTKFGAPHAEVEAVNSVSPGDQHLISQSTLYVSLEPCCITGKTPPCTDLIISKGIREVVISTLDPNPPMAGKGKQILEAQGISVTEGILEEEGKELIRSFAINILQQRPYVVLKWAQSRFGYIGRPDKRVLISHPYTLTWSHQLRSMSDAILAGARTIQADDPQLTTRSAPGKSPHRVIYDPNAVLHAGYKAFAEDGLKVFYFSKKYNTQLTGDHILQFELPDESQHADFILKTLFHHQIGVLLVEGGSHVLQMFIKINLWDEAWTIQSRHELEEGIIAPRVQGRLIKKTESATDVIVGIRNVS